MCVNCGLFASQTIGRLNYDEAFQNAEWEGGSDYKRERVPVEVVKVVEALKLIAKRLKLEGIEVTKDGDTLKVRSNSDILGGNFYYHADSTLVETTTGRRSVMACIAMFHDGGEGWQSLECVNLEGVITTTAIVGE
uniref:Uncharacterized protein n=1 Tax=Phaffia rhodozyma TaxID=264483 RepID=H9XW65_PHARH|nr:hypothetical protein [Phaffia rhodozyma]